MADSIACAVCGTIVPDSLRKNRKYCGDKCRTRVQTIRRSAIRAVPEIVCAWCGAKATNPPAGRNRKYCSVACRLQSRYARQRQDVGRPRICAWCGGPLHINLKGKVQRWCSARCQGRASRARIGGEELRRSRKEAYAREKATGAADAWAQRRRMAILDRPLDSVSALTLCIEQNYKCALCGKRINPKLSNRHPMMLSTDHVLPVSKGGDGRRANLRAVHYRCNLVKNNGVWGEGEQLGLC